MTMTHTTLARAEPAAGAGPAGGPVPTAAEILARARAAAPVLRERAAEIERARRLPGDVVDLLRATGAFRMTFPRSWGGPELTSVEQTEVVEALAYGDASAGWCAVIGSGTGLYTAFLDQAAARAMFTDLDMTTAGMLFPTGRADRVPGGYRLSGRWTFGSGITHADWVISGAFIHEAGSDGPVDSRQFLVPRAQVSVVDNWDPTGLAGSGSCDYTITDVFVPAEHTLSFDTVHVPAGPLTGPEVFMRPMAGVPLGVARAALDHASEVAATRWREDYRTQVAVAGCAADLAAARAGAYEALRRQWAVLSGGGTMADLTPAERAALPLSRLHAFRTARSVVTRLYDLLQTGSIHRPGPMDRWLRDTATMCQHVFAQDRILQSAGAHLLGGTPAYPLSLGLVG
jgi:alkylation response protein AidB-like acyl-CoA dehydrogenase